MNNIEKFGIINKLGAIAKNPPNEDCAVFLGRGWEFHIYKNNSDTSYYIVESEWIKHTIYDGKTLKEVVDCMDEDKVKSPLKAKILKDINNYNKIGA